MSHITPYPIMYLPKGVQRPSCCPHLGGPTTLDDKGPDYDPETKCGGGGMLLGSAEIPARGWKRTNAGWWVCLQGHRPQDLIRLAPHPRILRRRWIEGAHPGQRWSVPVLLQITGTDSYRSAIDGIWDGTQWGQGELRSLFEPLLAFANGVPLAIDLEARNRAMIDLAIGILAVDHWIDESFLIAAGWFSEQVMARAVLAAADAAGEEMR